MRRWAFQIQWIILAAFAAGQTPAQVATRLKPETAKAFDAYEEQVEKLMQKRQGGEISYLWLNESQKLRDQALRGGIPTEQLDGQGKVPGGLIHNWIAGMFVPNVSIDAFVEVFQDYGKYPQVYPEVSAVRVEERRADAFDVWQRLVKKKVLTVVLDTWHEIQFKRLDSQRYRVDSKTTRIQQVQNPNTPNESLLPPGEDDGFLWRLNVYWRLEQDDGGVFAECQSLSLSRDIPRGLGWIVKPFIRSMPSESLETSLQATRAAVVNHN